MYIYYVYINTHTCMYIIFFKYVVYILNMFIYDIIYYEHKYIHLNTYKYFLNICCMCVSIYIYIYIYIYIIHIHSTQTLCKQLLKKMWDVINRD